MRAPAHLRSSAYAQKLSPCHLSLKSSLLQWRNRRRGVSAPPQCKSGRDVLAIGGLPAPGAGAVAALGYPLLIDLRDDVAVAGKQRLGRAHLGAQRQLAFGQPIGAVFLVLGLAAVGLRATGAEGALVHLATRAEVADLGILRRAERTGVEAITATDADVLGVQDDRVNGRVEGVDRTDRRAGCV